MVQIEKGKVVIEIEEFSPGEYVKDLHDALCRLLCGYDKASFNNEAVDVVAGFMKELMPDSNDLNNLYKNK